MTGLAADIIDRHSTQALVRGARSFARHCVNHATQP
jgi:hypothetical protein